MMSAMTRASAMEQGTRRRMVVCYCVGYVVFCECDLFGEFVSVCKVFVTGSI